MSRFRKMINAKAIAGAVLAAGLVALGAPKASHAVTASGDVCSDLVALGPAATSYSTFVSCSGPSQDDFAAISAIVTALFGDEGISITSAGSFGPGAANGAVEDTGGPDEALAPGLDIDPDDVPGSGMFTFNSLPPNILFISFKQGRESELFRVPPGGTPFMLAHGIADDTSHISLWAGSTSVVPLPAALPLMLTALGGFAFVARRRKKMA